MVPSAGPCEVDYRLGRFQLPDTGDVSAVIAVAVVENKLLVALPEGVWSRVVARRRLPQRAIANPILCSVAACFLEERDKAIEGVECRVWFGLLSPALETNLDFVSEAPFDFDFSPEGEERLLPFSEALVAVSKEHFAFFTAESAVPECPAACPGSQEARIQKLEDSLGGIQDSLTKLLGHVNPATASQPQVGRVMKPAPKMTPARGSKKPYEGGYPEVAGLDQEAVAAVLSAGVPRRIEFFLEGWLDSIPITPEEMGRTAGKVESLEAMLSRLEEKAFNLAKTGAGYFPSEPQSDQPGLPLAFKEPALGTMATEGMSTFKKVDASRLSFVGRPHFDPTPYLDPLSRKIYDDPLAVRIPPHECHVKPPMLRVHCSRQEKVKLFELLDASGRLRIHCPHEVTPHFGSGLFSVATDLERDRLILDSRGANLLETPPQRWIKSLVSSESLCRLQLEEDEVLLSSGNDLRDFYYLFRATSSRSRRNVLVGALHPKEIQHLNAIKEEHLKLPCVFGALSSLTMGDCQAVELAQSCHLGLGLQNDIITADNLLTMYKPIPRQSTAVGLVIDDFVAMSKVKRCEVGCVQSEGALLADKMQRTYEEVELIPNTKKTFRDQCQSSFWGIDLDGDRGVLRGSLKRAIPLAWILLQIASVGFCTGDLMQVVVGSLISLFLYRRHFLSLLDSLFDSYRGRGLRDVFRLDGRVRSDLFVLASLLPLAATNLRAAAPGHVAASDASNWGEAGVFAKIPKVLGKELLRHCLRKSVWTKLLAPGAAVLRAKGLLSAEEELPDRDQCFETNPLWHLLAQMLEYKLLFAKEKTGQRHINIGELRAGLKTERLIASRRPSSRILLGLDSQVALGALTKGRSSSPAMNRELVRSIPAIVALDSYLDTMYFHTTSEPS